MIDWYLVEFQAEVMRFENEIYEALEDKDFKKAESLQQEFNEFKKANKNLFKEIEK